MSWDWDLDLASTGWALGHAVRTDPGAVYDLLGPGIVYQGIVHQVGVYVYAWCMDPGYIVCYVVRPGYICLDIAGYNILEYMGAIVVWIG